MNPSYPETRTVSTRLTWNDYTIFRNTCRMTGNTMHRVLRLLLAAWTEYKLRQFNVPLRLSERLRRALALDYARDTYNTIPEEWRPDY